MYPERTLDDLARLKARWQVRIVARRRGCASAAARVLVPLTWLDRAKQAWDRTPWIGKVLVGGLAGFVGRNGWRRGGRLASRARCSMAIGIAFRAWPIIQEVMRAWRAAGEKARAVRRQ